MTQPFMLVSLEEAKAKKLANVLGSETSTKILNELTKGKATESDLAKKLGMPISTVHYNLKQLVEAKLVTAKEFHYSSKGREVQHYELANKYIIIAPQEEQESFLEKLKGFFPVFIVAGAVAIAMKLSQLFTRPSLTEVSLYQTNDMIAPKAAEIAAYSMVESAPMAMDTGIMATESAPMIMDAANDTTMRMAESAPMDAMMVAANDSFSMVADEMQQNIAEEFAQETIIETTRFTVENQPFITNEMILFFLLGVVIVVVILILFRKKK